jgi:2-polyprenyl-3-methyl-5-hydroxy-6-metoxy-1,4-benzoquinol methylase
MDQPGLDASEHRRALEALRRVNAFSLGSRTAWPYIRAFCRAREGEGPAQPVRLLDVARGGGEFANRIARRARREGLPLEVAGCDVSPFAVGHASEQARRAGISVSFFRHDALSGSLPTGFDIVTCSLFLHHLDPPEAVALLRAMREAGSLALVDDLERGRFGWLLAYVGIRLLSRSSVAHVDGPLSVEGAFTRGEARRMALEAGWATVDVVPRWPCRFLLVGRD